MSGRADAYGGSVPDREFAEPRLAEIYDQLHEDRRDLDHYVGIVDEFGARSVLDVGCGTGTFACRLAGLGLDVIGVDPARASLNAARRKPAADRVRWICGTAADLPPMAVDLATMTGNVAQVFLSETEWSDALMDIRNALEPAGRLVFESRDPSRRAWEKWNAEATRSTAAIDGVGLVEFGVDLVDVSLPFVSFRWTYRFASDGAVLTSDSTLRFRERDELVATLEGAGYAIDDVRDAPDRPGLEFVFIARAGS